MIKTQFLIWSVFWTGSRFSFESTFWSRSTHRSWSGVKSRSRSNSTYRFRPGSWFGKRPWSGYGR